MSFVVDRYLEVQKMIGYIHNNLVILHDQMTSFCWGTNNLHFFPARQNSTVHRLLWWRNNGVDDDKNNIQVYYMNDGVDDDPNNKQVYYINNGIKTEL